MNPRLPNRYPLVKPTDRQTCPRCQDGKGQLCTSCFYTTQIEYAGFRFPRGVPGEDIKLMEEWK